MRQLIGRVTLFYVCLATGAVAGDVDFARQIAPIFSEHCVRCHSDGIAKGDLSLSRIDDLNENEYLVAGEPDESHLIDLIAGVDGEPPAMPKDEEALNADQVALIRQWITEGAKWPADVVVREKSKADASWWSLQPVRTDFSESTIDGFIDARLLEKDLRRNAAAERRTLIRRATYDLLGLPPTAEEIDAFVQDTDPRAYEKRIDRLLESPHYGERWGRHWLDVVRFGESIGYERNVIINNLWPFRDYVIRSINEDKPFDDLIREHLAGDVFGSDDPTVAVASAFLVAGPYDDVGNQDAAQAAQIRANTLDEIIRATSQAFLGLTVGCARCHDHKFDPILQSDYYSMYATFAGVRHGSAELGTPEAKAERAAKKQPLDETRGRLNEEITKTKKTILDRAQSHLVDYQSQWTRPAVDRRGTEEKFSPVATKFVRFTCDARDSDLKAKSGFRIEEFEAYNTDGMNVALAANGGTASGSSRHIEDFDNAYSADLAIDGRTGARFIAAGRDLTIEFAKLETIERVVFSSAKQADKLGQGKFTTVAEYRIEVSLDGEQWREVANGRDRKPTVFASNPTHEEFRLLELETTDDERKALADLRKQLNRVKRDLNALPPVESVWIGSRNSPDGAGPFHVFLGGSPQKKGESVTAHSLSVVGGEAEYDLDAEKSEAERRMALANWLTHSSNPLTARVLANRVWHYHFGTGIVDTPNDFGFMGGRPTHPELLDFLAAQLVENDWRIKPLHRLIMLSETYRQSSESRIDAAKLDGDARLLWRFPPRRLSSEEIRDTILMACGQLDVHTGEAASVPDGGPGFRLYHFMQDNVCTYAPLDEHGPATYRRAVYHQNARASVIDLMTDFDQPDCTFSAPRRAETTTPLQALTMLNHKFTLEMAQALADRLQREAGSQYAAQVKRAYEVCLGREAVDDEVSMCVELVNEHGMTALCRVLLNTTEMIYVR